MMTSGQRRGAYAQRILSALATSMGLPAPTLEHRPLPPRLWRLDLAWPEHRVGVELHGGVFRQGHHTRGRGFCDDREKMNTLQLAGWVVLEYATATIEKEGPGIIGNVRVALEARGWKGGS